MNIHKKTELNKGDAAKSSGSFVLYMVVCWTVVFAVYSSFLHEVFRSSSLDMALHSQILWNLPLGRFMQTSLMPCSFAGNHFWPGFYLLVPVYQWLGIHGVLALQCIVVAAGAFAAYLMAKEITKNETWARMLALAYLLQPTLSIGVLFDYHLELFSVAFAMFALLGLRRNSLWFWPCMILSWWFYEINAIVWFFIGLGILSCRNRRKTGILVAASSLAYISIVFFVIMPYFKENAAVPHWERYSHLGNTPAEAIAAMVIHPFRSLAQGITLKEIGRLRYLFIAFGCLPLLGIKHFLPAVPLLFVLLMSSCGINSDIRFGYMAPILPLLFLSAAHGAGLLNNYTCLRKQHVSRYGPYILLSCSLFIFAYFQIKRPIRGNPFHIRHNLAELRLARELIPKSASLSADNHIGPHFANREILLVTPATEYNSKNVEFIFTDLSEAGHKNSDWLDSLCNILDHGDYGPVFFANDVLVLKREITNRILTEKILAQIASKQLEN